MNPHPEQGSTGEEQKCQVSVRCLSCECHVSGVCQVYVMRVSCVSGVSGVCQVYVRRVSGVCQVSQVSCHSQTLHTPTCSRGVMLQFQLVSM